MKKNILIYIFITILLNGCGNEDESIGKEGSQWTKAGDSFVLGTSNPPYDHRRFKKYRNSYFRLWSSMRLRSNRLSTIDKYVNDLIANRGRYQKVSSALNNKVPWAFIGIVHILEGGGNFNTHLHNGDSLKAKTWRVPAGSPGRPPANGSRYTWEESALDAMRFKEMDHWKGWDSIQVWGYAFEGYNGFGYRRASVNIPSPYLWSFTHHYSKGKYCRDGVYCPGTVSEQAGAMAMLKRLQQKGFNPFTGQQSSSAFNDTSPNIGKRCYAMNPYVVGEQHRIVARGSANKQSKPVKFLPPGSIFSPVAVSSDGNWYNMSFQLDGVTFGKNKPAWVHHDQVDCNNYVGKTCRLETSFGEVISMRGGAKNSGPNGTVTKTYVPNLQAKVLAVNKSKLWYYVDFTVNHKKHNGWIYRDQLNCSGQPQVFSNKKLCLKLMADGAPIKVRVKPGADNDIKVLKTLSPTAQVTSLMKVGNWHAVKFVKDGEKFGVTFGRPAYIYVGQTRPCG